MSLLNADYLRHVLSYDPETGVFTWAEKISNTSRVVVGSVAGCLSRHHGYIFIGIEGKLYRAHRLAWLYMTGEWPADVIDHRDCNCANNRWDNLRLATISQNKANSRRYKSNTSGFKGVYWQKDAGKWRARIRVGGKYSHIGLYERAEDAHAAYVAKATELFGEFARAA